MQLASMISSINFDRSVNVAVSRTDFLLSRSFDAFMVCGIVSATE
jgi:hypothetical protein